MSDLPARLALPTLRIVCDDVPAGYVIINQVDFDPSKQVKFTGKKEAAKPVTPPAPAT